MNKKERVAFITKTLNALFPNPPISLTHKDPFTLLVAVVLSAQCTDERVNQITPKLFQKGGSAKALAAMPLEEIENIIRPCGLAGRKAKALSELSKIIVSNYQSQVPRTFKELEALPGVGHKTASVVLSQAFNIPAFPVDTHIFRLARRWGLSQGKTVVAVEKDLKKCFPEKSWGVLHLQMIYFARTYCKAVGHVKSACPICSKI